MKVVLADDKVSLSYRTVGRGPHTIFLIHGWLLSGAWMEELTRQLDTQTLRVIVPDLRGSGASGKPETGYCIEQFAHDILTIAEAEQVASFVVVGHSMGAQVAQWLAATYPQRILGCCLICPVPASGVTLPEDLANTFRNAHSSEVQRSIFESSTNKLPAETISAMIRDASQTIPAAVREGFDAWSRGAGAENLKNICAPTLVISTDDGTLPRDFLLSAVVGKIKNARLAYLPGPGHFAHIERPRETAALIEAFLAGLLR